MSLVTSLGGVSLLVTVLVLVCTCTTAHVTVVLIFDIRFIYTIILAAWARVFFFEKRVA